MIAADGRGRPGLLRRRVGADSVILSACPVERMAATTPYADPGPVTALYAAPAARWARTIP